MRGGQPPLAPKSSHKVLRSFPPPHRLRGKPLKIPKKPRPPAVIPASFAKQNLVSTRMRATHCEEPVQGDVAIHFLPVITAHPPPPVIAALDAAISFYIVCRVKPDNDKGGNDRATWQSSIFCHCEIFVQKTVAIH